MKATMKATMNAIAVDRAGDAIIDAALNHMFLTEVERSTVRHELQDLVDALVDACREHYRYLFVPEPSE